MPKNSPKNSLMWLRAKYFVLSSILLALWGVGLYLQSMGSFKTIPDPKPDPFVAMQDTMFVRLPDYSGEKENSFRTEFEWGTITIEISSPIKYMKETYHVYLSLEHKPLKLHDLSEGLESARNVIDSTYIAGYLEAELFSIGFAIDTLYHPQKQLVDINSRNNWAWNIVANDYGKIGLILDLFAVLEIDNRDHTRRILNASNVAYVFNPLESNTPPSGLLKTIRENVPIINLVLTFLLVPVGGFLWRSYRKQSRKIRLIGFASDSP